MNIADKVESIVNKRLLGAGQERAVEELRQAIDSWRVVNESFDVGGGVDCQIDELKTLKPFRIESGYTLP